MLLLHSGWLQGLLLEERGLLQGGRLLADKLWLHLLLHGLHLRLLDLGLLLCELLHDIFEHWHD